MTYTNSMHEAGNPKPVLWDNQRKGGEEGGKGIQDGGGGNMNTCG